jgi:hypothetical protein
VEEDEEEEEEEELVLLEVDLKGWSEVEEEFLLVNEFLLVELLATD